jgi:Flp pilus assembly protein TadG
VEFALAATATLIFLFGIVIAGRAIFSYDLVASAARQGARWAMVRGSGCAVSGCPATKDSIKTYVDSVAPQIASTASVTTAWSTGTGCTDANDDGRGCTVAVTVTYPFLVMYPLKSTISMSSTSTMVIAQ